MGENIWIIIATAAATLMGSLGLPTLYKSFFGHLSEKNKAEVATKEEIQNLKLQISQIVTSVDMLLIVIKDEFENSPNIQTAILRVEEHLHKVSSKN